MRKSWEIAEKVLKSGLVLWSCLVWSGLVWSGMVRSGLVYSDLVWSGLVWSGLVVSGLVWSGLIWGYLEFGNIEISKPAISMSYWEKYFFQKSCPLAASLCAPPPLIPTEPGSQTNPNTLEVYYSLPHSITYSNTAITVILPYSHTAVLYYTALLCIVVCVDTYADIWNASFQLCPHLSLSLGLYCACANSIEFLKKGNFIWRVSKKFDLQ